MATRIPKPVRRNITIIARTISRPSRLRRPTRRASTVRRIHPLVTPRKIGHPRPSRPLRVPTTSGPPRARPSRPLHLSAASAPLRTPPLLRRPLHNSISGLHSRRHSWSLAGRRTTSRLGHSTRVARARLPRTATRPRRVRMLFPPPGMAIAVVQRLIASSTETGGEAQGIPLLASCSASAARSLRAPNGARGPAARRTCAMREYQNVFWPVISRVVCDCSTDRGC